MTSLVEKMNLFVGSVCLVDLVEQYAAACKVNQAYLKVVQNHEKRV